MKTSGRPNHELNLVAALHGSMRYCIDQSNLQERMNQVLLMRRIFEQATQVIVWLGPPSPGTQRVFQPLGSLTKASPTETSEQRI